ncbi:TIGR00282 family metallophosphoesterase [Leadbettera azotonutricia]|uniref:Ser/Thr protein phosphatase family protein n=1 Tax=Leadbettera azotonutricia (strain ATCC BAA-888 / DSM 13862 / ZAS-9) TaxID=545695 RepID=F5YFR6_LEAAZ|nr:TIGR00282 family metallophosphoesterase [Leadbettera azotonutricia]AEF82664.1 Ser/Thr protein phosphatase family protein [Leadbettera azotonutricia ZAS-9]
MASVWVLMIGDVIGDPGLEILEKRLPDLIKEYSASFVAVNGENSAGGFGFTQETFDRILKAGADVVTSGNHVWEKRDFWPVLESDTRILRPANYPGAAGNSSAPGRGWVRMDKDVRGTAVSLVAVNLQGREFMTPIDCPFKAFDAIDTENAIVLVDFHAESTKEKEALGFYLDGRASVVAGTHTHIQTADERILPKGTAYITDLGMTGVTSGVIGMDAKICIDRARNQVLYRMETATGGQGAAVQGIAAEIDLETRKAISVKRINLEP